MRPTAHELILWLGWQRETYLREAAGQAVQPRRKESSDQPYLLDFDGPYSPVSGDVIHAGMMAIREKTAPVVHDHFRLESLIRTEAAQTIQRAEEIEAQVSSKNNRTEDSNRSRGRPVDTDAESDAKITDEWQQANRNGCKTIREFAARTVRDEGAVRAAIDRDRKRR